MCVCVCVSVCVCVCVCAYKYVCMYLWEIDKVNDRLIDRLINSNILR